jgi:hypothetical protein
MPSCAFVKWEDSLPPFSYDPAAAFSSLLVPTVDTARYGWLVSACLSAGAPALLVGDGGAGKTALVVAQLAALATAGGGGGGGAEGHRRLVSALLTCSSGTGAATVRALLNQKLTKRSGR